MKNLMAAPLCLLLMVLGFVQGQSQYNNMCVSCVMANSSNYYCSNTNLCSNVSVPIQSCD